MVLVTWSVGRNNRPWRVKNVLSLKSSTDLNKFGCCESFWDRALLAALASSEVGASTTTRIVSCPPGNAREYASSRCRHGKSREINWLTSVLILKLRTV